MQIEALKIFCDVVTHHSFSVAAEINKITQSTASQSVHRLEEYLGTQLIDRANRPWKVTETGRRCFSLSQEVLEAYDRLEREVSKTHHMHNNIRVGSIYSVGFTYMSECAKAFGSVAPKDTLEVTYLHPEVIPDRVLKDEIDLGIVSFPGHRRDFECIPLIDEEFVLVCAPDNELSRRDSLVLSDLHEKDFVCFDSDLRISREINHTLREANVQRRVVLTFDNIEAIKRAVEDSSYLAILPRPTVERELAVNTLCAIPFSGISLKRPLSIIYKKTRKLTPAKQQFIAILRETVKKKMSPKRFNINRLVA